MNKRNIVFFGAMAAMLLAANANAAQIASKEYVDAREDAIVQAVNDAFDDYSTTSEVTNMITTAVSTGTADVAGKADKVTGATDGNLAGLDTTGNLTDSGVSATGVASMQTNITNLQSSVTTIGGAVTNLETTVAGKADATDLTGLATKTEVTSGLATKADTTAMTTALSGKADLQGAGDAGVIATVDANGQYIRSTTALADVATTENVTTIVEGAVNTAVANINTSIDDMETRTHADATYETKDNVTAGLALKEDVANKSNNIATDTGSATKYTTVNAVETYALPRPPANCSAPSTQCVLAVNTSGEPYWEAVVIP